RLGVRGAAKGAVAGAMPVLGGGRELAGFLEVMGEHLGLLLAERRQARPERERDRAVHALTRPAHHRLVRRVTYEGVLEDVALLVGRASREEEAGIDELDQV